MLAPPPPPPQYIQGSQTVMHSCRNSLRLYGGSVKRFPLFLPFRSKEKGSDARILADTSLGVFLLLFRGSAVNGPSVKSVGLKARGPDPLRSATQWSTVNYFTLIVPSCNFSFLSHAGGNEEGCLLSN